MRDMSIERLWETFTEELRADGGSREPGRQSRRNGLKSLVVFGHVA